MMRFQCPTIRRILCALGVLVSLIVGLATPIGYWVVGRTYAEEALEAKAELARGRVAKFVYAHRDLWQYQSLRLFELVATPEFAGELVRIGVVDQDGQEVMREDTPLAWPVLKQRVAVEVGGETIGWVEAEASLSTLMMRTGRVAGCASTLETGNPGRGGMGRDFVG